MHIGLMRDSTCEYISEQTTGRIHPVTAHMDSNSLLDPQWTSGSWQKIDEWSVGGDHHTM